MPPQRHPPLSILCFGASLVEGYTSSGATYSPYSITLSRLLKERFPGRQITVETDGKSGDLVTGGFAERMRDGCKSALLFSMTKSPSLFSLSAMRGNCTKSPRGPRTSCSLGHYRHSVTWENCIKRTLHLCRFHIFLPCAEPEARICFVSGCAGVVLVALALPLPCSAVMVLPSFSYFLFFSPFTLHTFSFFVRPRVRSPSLLISIFFS
jgi:hypothetical protein